MNHELFLLALVGGIVSVGISVGIMGTIGIVLASGPEWDCDEDYIDIPGACNCWHSGYMNGTVGFSAFNVTENEECKDKGNQYQAGFDAASKSSSENFKK